MLRRRLPLVLALALGALVAPAREGASHEGSAAELAALDAKLDREPDRREWLLERAALLRLRGDFGAALADLEALDELDPEAPELCLERGLLLARFGHPTEAEWDLSCYLGAHPHAPRALVARAQVRAWLGDRIGARSDYEEAAVLAPTLDHYLAWCDFEEHEGGLELAAECLTRGLGELHDAVMLARALVRIETARRNYDRAIAIVDRLIAASAFKADAYLDRADLYEAAGKDALARADRERALGLLDESVARRPSELRHAARMRALWALADDDD